LARRTRSAGKAPSVGLARNQQLLNRRGISAAGGFDQARFGAYHMRCPGSLRPTMAHIGQKPTKPVLANMIPPAIAIHVIHCVVE
jgi:hypothetical protein